MLKEVVYLKKFALIMSVAAIASQLTTARPVFADTTAAEGVNTASVMFTAEQCGGTDMDMPDSNTASKPYCQTERLEIRTSERNATDEPIDKRAYYKADLSAYSSKILRKVYFVTSVREYKSGSVLHINPVTQDWDVSDICYNNSPEYDASTVLNFTLAQEKICELDITSLVTDELKLNVMLTCTHPQNANFAGGNIKSYANLGGILNANINRRTYLKVVYTDDYLPPKADVTFFDGSNISGSTLNMDYEYFSYENDPEGDSIIEWLISDAPDGDYTVIEGQNSKQLVITEEMADMYIKAAVIPHSASGVYTVGNRAVSANAIGPIFGKNKINEIIRLLNECTVVDEYVNIVKDNINLFGVSVDEYKDEYGEIFENALPVMINADISEPKELKPLLERALLLATLNAAEADDIGQIVCNEKFCLDADEYKKLKNTDGINSALTQKFFQSLDLFDKEFMNNLAFYRFSEADRTNVKILLVKYDNLFDEDISAMNDNLLSQTGVFLLHEDYSDIHSLNLAVTNSVAKAKTAIAEQERKENNRGSSGGSGGSSRVSMVTPISPPTVDSEIDVKKADTYIAVSNGNFDDIGDVPWAKKQIVSLAKQGIINGVGERNFCPNDYVTREQFAKMLAGAFGFSGGKCLFADVTDDDWFSPYIGALASKKIVTGVSANTFGCGQNITREEMAVMIGRALSYDGLNFDDNKFVIFEDDSTISDWASYDVSHMAYLGIISGFEDGTFRPHEFATRAMASVMIFNATEHIGGAENEK